MAHRREHGSLARGSTRPFLVSLLLVMAPTTLALTERCVVTIASGNRPWFVGITQPRLRAYARRMRASYEVLDLDTFDVPPEVVDAYTQVGMGNRNNTVYMVKMLGIGRALERCERVL